MASTVRSAIAGVRTAMSSPTTVARVHLRVSNPTLTTAAAVTQTTGLHTTPLSRLPYKHDQNRNDLKPVANEHTKSGSDEDVAAQDEAAFNPKVTSPEAEKDVAGKAKKSGNAEGASVNPLDASPANPDISQPQEKELRGSTAEDKSRRSGGGAPKKRGKVHPSQTGV